MQIQTVSYHKTFNLGGYSNEKIGVEIKLQENENPIDAFAEAKRIVEKSHKFFQDQPNYERAKDMVRNPDEHTGRDIKPAQEAIEAFEANYPEYIARFTPAFRTLNRPDELNDSYQDDDMPM